MEYQDELYCEIFVDGPESADKLREFLQGVIGGTLERRDIRVNNAEIFVATNDSTKLDRADSDPKNDFLYYPYRMDVDALPSQTRDNHIALVSTILQQLWSQGYKAVAACDYEDELPTNSHNSLDS